MKKKKSEHKKMNQKRNKKKRKPKKINQMIKMANRKKKIHHLQLHHQLQELQLHRHHLLQQLELMKWINTQKNWIFKKFFKILRIKS